MAREYGFTQQEKDTYYLGKRVYSSWGRDDDNDYIAAFVYSVPGDVLLAVDLRTGLSFKNMSFNAAFLYSSDDLLVIPAFDGVAKPSISPSDNKS